MKIFKPSDLEKMDEAYHSEPDNRHDCMNGMTLPSWHWTCDGDKDCPDGDDESVCNNTEWEHRGKFLRKIRATFIITATQRQNVNFHLIYIHFRMLQYPQC